MPQLYCPEGKESWCKFQRDKATGEKTHKHDHPLPIAIIDKIKPVSDRLSDDNLLGACLEGYTQNACESVNSVVWTRLPKETFVRNTVFRAGVAISVAKFNDLMASVELCQYFRNLEYRLENMLQQPFTRWTKNTSGKVSSVRGKSKRKNANQQDN